MYYSISTHNAKTGYTPSFNLLAGNENAAYYEGYTPKTCAGANNCAGTCAQTCTGCYALKMTRYPRVFMALRNNTERARADIAATRGANLIREITAFCLLNEPRRFRIHDSGEFFSYEYFCAWDKIATTCPDTKFYTYTKRLDLLEKFVKEHDRAPAFVVQLSTWPTLCELYEIESRGLADFPRFEYDDGTRPELRYVPHCPAVDCAGKRTGITCSQCKHCSNAKSGDVWAVYAH